MPRTRSESLPLLGVLDFSGCGSVDLGEILQSHPRIAANSEIRHPPICTITRRSLEKDQTLGQGSWAGFRLLMPRIRSESLLLLGLLDFSGCGSVDLGEIRQFRPWKCFAFKFSQLHSRTLVRDERPKIAMYSGGTGSASPGSPARARKPFETEISSACSTSKTTDC